MSVKLPVLMYHAVDESRSVLATSPATFAWQMHWLKRNQFKVLSLPEVAGCLQRNLDFPPRSIAITFDDGFESVYQHAFPILSQHGFPAMVFLVGDYVGERNDWPGQPAGLNTSPLANWDQIREMDRAGIHFGSHSLSHPRLDQLSTDELHRQIAGSQSLIAEQLGHAVSWFAYPYGRLTEPVKDAVRDGYEGACSANLGMVHAQSDRYTLARVETYYLRDFRIFKLLSGRFFERYLDVRRLLRITASWALRRTW